MVKPEIIKELEAITSKVKLKGQVFLTQAEYDNLPSTKESDGVLYLI